MSTTTEDISENVKPQQEDFHFRPESLVSLEAARSLLPNKVKTQIRNAIIPLIEHDDEPSYTDVLSRLCKIEIRWNIQNRSIFELTKDMPHPVVPLELKDIALYAVNLLPQNCEARKFLFIHIVSDQRTVQILKGKLEINQPSPHYNNEFITDMMSLPLSSDQINNEFQIQDQTIDMGSMILSQEEQKTNNLPNSQIISELNGIVIKEGVTSAHKIAMIGDYINQHLHSSNLGQIEIIAHQAIRYIQSNATTQEM